MAKKRYKITIQGTVQGIGFRPFVYREAIANSIAGYVLNDSSGVTIEAEGSETNLANFIETVRTLPPPFADIHELRHQEIPLNGDSEFRIVASESSGKAETLISADIATCADCVCDITDPKNRRYRYPFTNCTNCGPRYTIIEGVPYDRPYTAMKNFRMCPECEAEYNDPLNRRYHAQPNCCPNCGPHLILINTRATSDEPRATGSDAISITVDLLSKGKIIAIKGLGGFHLAVDASNDEAVRRLRRRKKRDEKPFAVMMPGVETVRQYCELNDSEEKILTSPQRPITLLRRKIPTSNNQIPNIADSAAPNNCYLGVMLPYTPLHHLLFKNTQTPKHPNTLIMTSANISDEPICYKNDEAIERLKEIADYFLVHDRDIFIRTDDSITRVVNDRPLMIRRARGYTPQPIKIITNNEQRTTNNEILAAGPDLKNTICLIKGDNAFISQHIGDLENTASYESFENTISHIQKLFDIKPNIIAHDMHPNYFSTKWATTNTPGVLVVGVQHHHAHIASCMAENRLEKPVIGIALDGTGYGTDGNIWGGEILIADYKGFERAGHLEYVPLPGGDAAIKNPWQTVLSFLSAGVFESLSVRVVKNEIPSFRSIPDQMIDLVLNMIERKINTPLTSSCGRLFDAVASILGLRHTVSFEGQAALELEMLASSIEAGERNQESGFCYPYSIINSNAITISYISTIKAIVEGLKAGISVSKTALRFHNTVISSLSETVRLVSKKYGINDIALSGGCFQNVILTEGLKKSLECIGFNVYTHSLIPPNDGGISLGQAVIAHAITKSQPPNPNYQQG